MSVVVKGMEMPDHCWECWLMRNLICGASGELIPSTGKRKYCPLVDLGKHGRLVDADEVVGGLAKAIPYFIDDAVTTAYVEGLQRAKIEIDDAPTVIEAEDGT